MNWLRRAIDRWRHPGETDDMRYRRRYISALHAQEREPDTEMGTAHVDIACACGHVRSRHLIASAAYAECRECVACHMFRGERVVLS